MDAAILTSLTGGGIAHTATIGRASLHYALLGGIVFAIETQLGIPVKLVGLGETIGDLVPFNPEEYVRELFAEA